ncbi:DNA polymerase V [Methylobacterium sp. yr596]|jgi:DNA polymerase V|nr:DNA polymerase V [Methylobacterium sp. yr596]
MRYRSWPADDGEVRSRLRELAQQRRRFGHRWLHIPPICVGIGPTKTLAKLANHIAKIIPELGSVCGRSDEAERAAWMVGVSG